MIKRSITTIWILAFMLPIMLFAQKDASPYDFGRMWTFENPPTEWFQEAYGIEADQEWFDYIRKSSLRFATWCSASFVSPDGLIMTNHHCSRDVVTALQNEDENFDKNGFYAKNLSDERRSEDLFVEQLIKVANISDEVLAAAENAENQADADDKKMNALETIKARYATMTGWEGLRLEVVTYYSGGRYSLYGYKKYDDIRLVLIPELDLGFYGGDPDNFTYPRYNLDVTFWRAYDENGKALNTSANYLKFNPEGAKEGEPVFVVGNPGSTERYRTVAQLEYDRDYRFPMTYKFLKNRNDFMVRQYDELKKDPSKEREAQELLNTIANIANGMKAYGGIVGGLKDKELFGRKVAMEEFIRSKSPGVAYWDDLANAYQILNPNAWAVTHLSPSGLRGKIYGTMHMLASYEEMVKEDAPEETREGLKASILENASAFDDPEEVELFTMFLTEISEDIYPGDPTLKQVLDGKSLDQYVKWLVKETKYKKEDKAAKCLKEDKILKDDDPMMKAARLFVPRFQEALVAFQGSGATRKSLEAQIANQVFKVYGDKLPPDATFTLRISDGVIKGYDYNGTIAPVITTYYGLYDRHYSHGEVFPWSLPERWLKPSLELLKSPFNTVSTNDIIGGNSGSPLINKNKEAVGLIFDGNIESLPGNFIFDEKYNRTVSVHAGGIMAALKHIYKAERLVNELEGE